MKPVVVREVIEDELSTLPGGRVTVYPTGEVKVSDHRTKEDLEFTKLNPPIVSSLYLPLTELTLLSEILSVCLCRKEHKDVFSNILVWSSLTGTSKVKKAKARHERKLNEKEQNR